MGKGFPLDRLPASTTSSVLLFATGSGISPLRAVIDSGALAGRDVTLYYGTRNPGACWGHSKVQHAGRVRAAMVPAGSGKVWGMNQAQALADARAARCVLGLRKRGVCSLKCSVFVCRMTDGCMADLYAADSTAYRELLPAWEAAGVKVVQVGNVQSACQQLRANTGIRYRVGACTGK